MTGESNKAKTGVFWNMEDCPIPGGLSPEMILENIKSSVANESYDPGEVSIRAYREKQNCSFDDLSLAEITFVTAGNQLTRFKKILEDIFLWAVKNRVHPPETIHKVVLISNIPQDSEISFLLTTLEFKGYIVLVAVPDALAYVSSVWLWPTLTRRVNTVDHQSGSSYPLANKGKKFHEAMTGVFWNIDDFPFPEGHHPPNVNHNIKSALRSNGYNGGVSISTYTDKYGSVDGMVFYFSLSGITLQNKVLKGELRDDSDQVDQMLVDILLWALDNPAPSNLLVISKDMSEETELLKLLQALESKGYNILVAHTEEAASAVLAYTESSEWLSKSLKSLFGGVHPIEKLKHHEACTTTTLFWNMEDCPVPSGFDTPYCEKNSSSLDDFSPTDIRFVPTGNKSAIPKKMFSDILFCALENPKASNLMLIIKTIPDNFYNVLRALTERDINVLIARPHSKYAKSVWLWPDLAGGGRCID
ncbi:hypothetical protein AALP_AA3G364500 [Arabis alpina]|uniref:NYN domain-containing protein n=1 Tax=Arabis alpina TaxID=50452 RepID=A0A087HE14_ARAAL|nr:hypothetical protein AALP_AA3G364500 [Arabis alpina]